MCGIAGYSLSPKSSVDRTLAAQALLAAIAERGADAVGYAYRVPGRPAVRRTSSDTGASAVLDRIAIPADAHQLLLHVRDYTKGHPSIAANNHPVRHGPVVGVHNGTILNDDELLARHGFERAEPRMTVDSEVIFAARRGTGSDARAFEELPRLDGGSLARRAPAGRALPRARRGPAALGRRRPPRALLRLDGASALEIAERYTGVRLRKREVAEGTLLALQGPQRRPPRALHARIRPTRPTPCRPCARPAKATSACSGSPRSPPV